MRSAWMSGFHEPLKFSKQLPGVPTTLGELGDVIIDGGRRGISEYIVGAAILLAAMVISDTIIRCSAASAAGSAGAGGRGER